MRIQVVSNALRPVLPLIPGFLIAWASYLAFQDLMYRGLDGSYYFLLARELGSFGSFWPGLTLDHLQGCSSLQFPVNFNLSLTFRLADLLPFSQKADVFFASLLLLATGTLLLAKILRFDGLASGIFFLLNLVALLPIPAGFYGLAGCAPVFAELSMLAVLGTVLMLNPSGNNRGLSTFFIYLIFLYVGIVYTTFLVFFLPLLLLWAAIVTTKFVGLLKLAWLRNQAPGRSPNCIEERASHIVLGVLLLMVGLWVCGHLLNSPFAYFKSHMLEKMDLSDVSLIFWNPRSLAAVVLLLIGLVSAMLILFQRVPMGLVWVRIAAFILVFTFSQGLMVIGIKTGLVPTRGFALIYTEYLFYPLYFTLVVAILHKVFGAEQPETFLFLPRFWHRAILSLGLLGLGFSFFRHLPDSSVRLGPDYFQKPEKNQITEALAKSIERCGESKVFAGRCEPFLGLGTPRQAAYDWSEFHAFQGLCLDVFRNDFRTTGLWTFGIPTLFQYSPLRDPFLHYFARNFLARPEDKSRKNVPITTVPNLKALGLLGIRFVITDSSLPDEAGSQVGFLPWPPETESKKTAWWQGAKEKNPWNGIEGIYLYHLSRVNLGNRTPLLEYSDQDDANTILEILKRRGFFENGFPIAVHSQKNLDAPFLAQKVEISYAPTGFHVCASAQGRSGLLLPLTFSHCLEFIPKEKSQFFEKPKLYRANLAQTLLIFNQKVEGEVRYFSSPFYNPLAVWKDVLDGRRIFGNTLHP